MPIKAPPMNYFVILLSAKYKFNLENLKKIKKSLSLRVYINSGVLVF